jgi:AraC-like DNA-binding protein
MPWMSELRTAGPSSADADPALRLILGMFETIPHVMVCIKSADGRYVGANEAFVQRTEAASRADIVGRRAAELFPEEQALSYDAQDRSLVRSGIAVRNQLEIITTRRATAGWYLTTKQLHAPAAPATDPVIVVVSVVANLPRRGTTAGDGIRSAVDHARANLHRVVTVTEMAAAAGLSTDQLERVMRRALAVSPKQLLMRMRAERAAHLLATTATPLVDVATACGFYDQSQFTRQFAAHHGVTPGAYRLGATGS